MKEPQTSRVMSLVGLLCAAVLAAVGLSLFMLHSYGPTGRYATSTTLVRPDLVPILSFNDGNARYVFDSLEFRYFDPALGDVATKRVTPDGYRQFYRQLSSDESVVDDDGFDALFAQGSALLTIWVHAEGETTKRPFQQIEFAHEGNLYRVQLRDEGSDAPEWAYYRHAAILQQAKSIFLDE